jgi:hypothetical protein
VNINAGLANLLELLLLLLLLSALVSPAHLSSL